MRRAPPGVRAYGRRQRRLFRCSFLEPLRIVNVRHLLTAAAVMATVAAAPTARAQTSEAQPHFGPTVLAASAAARPDLRMDASVPRALDVRQQLRRSETLMIIGGAIFLAGAIIGDEAGTVIMIGGAGIGIYGLYLYLQ
jgi:hypothetical protein